MVTLKTTLRLKIVADSGRSTRSSGIVNDLILSFTAHKETRKTRLLGAYES